MDSRERRWCLEKIGKLDLSGDFIVVCGGPGAGKDTLKKVLAEILPNPRSMKSVTTRPPEPEGSERAQCDKAKYTHVAAYEFERMDSDELFAWTTPVIVNGARYGTLKTEMAAAMSHPGVSMIDVEVGTVPNIARIAGDKLIPFFVKVTEQVREERLRSRDVGKDEQYYRERVNLGSEWAVEVHRQFKLKETAWQIVRNDDRKSIMPAVRKVIERLCEMQCVTV